MIAYALVFMAGAFCGGVVIAFLIGARRLNEEIEDWERRNCL